MSYDLQFEPESRARHGRRFFAVLGVFAVLTLGGYKLLELKDQRPSADFSPTASEARIDSWMDSAKSSKLRWQSCTPPEAEVSVECASLTVPVDWFQQSDATTSIPLVRVLSSSAEPAGDLMVNPGGPGGSGTDLALTLATNPSTETLRAHFNLLGFDPRGVQGVTGRADDPLDCDAGADCSTSTRLERHASTAAVAHDMEYLRMQTGGKPLNYLGYSYGTYLGSIYATLFPGSVGSMVLDGPADAEGYSLAGLQEQEDALMASRERFLDSCVKGELGACPFHDSVDKAEDDIAAAAEKYDKKPVKLDDGREVNGASVDDYLGAALYGPRSTWVDIASTLTGVMNADPAALDTIAGETNAVPDNISDAVICSIAASQETGGCADKILLDPRVSYSGKAHILVFAVTGDPATPYVGAERFTNDLGNATLVTVDGEGHGATYEQSTCADAIANAFLVSGTVPASGVRCSADG